MKNNKELKRDVLESIKWEPQLSDAKIEVTAKDGVVTLNGTVDSYAKKVGVEASAITVSGVIKVVDNVVVKTDIPETFGDNEIAMEALNSLEKSWVIPKGRVKVKVEDGWITLSGELAWNYERVAARTLLIHHLGVRGVTNDIKIVPPSKDIVEKKDIERALERNWSIHNKDIHVTVSSGRVTLTGLVNSIYQKEEAERLVWNTPGVWNLVNELEVEYDGLLAV